MGAWGTGPFDSDSALDYLGSLADQVAKSDADGAIMPGTVDFTLAAAELGKTLRSDDRYQDGHEIYAAAGLVAAALDPTITAESAGTNLFSRTAGDKVADADPQLGAHCGFVALLNSGTARELAPLARDALTALRQDEDWCDQWVTPIQPTLDAVLDRLG